MIGTVYGTPCQNNFLETLNQKFPSKHMQKNLSNFDRNVYEKDKYIAHENYKVCTKLASTDVKSIMSFV